MAVPSPYPGIQIESNELNFGKPRYDGVTYWSQKHQFRANTLRDLDILAHTGLGADLLSLIGKRAAGVGTKDDGRTVTIAFRPMDKNQGASAGAIGMEKRFRVQKTMKGGGTMSFAGKGSASMLRMHNEPGSEQTYTMLAGVQTPTWIALAHELIHAFHHLSGTAYADSVNAPGGEVKREEMWTTGLGPYVNTRISENAIRAQAGLPLRTHYTFPNDHSFMPSQMQQVASQRPGYWICSCLQKHLEEHLGIGI